MWRALKARKRPRAPRPVDNSPEARARRAVQAAREGMTSRARSGLEIEFVVVATEQTRDKLQTKHHEARHPLPAFSFVAHVEEAVLSFNKGTSCGTMGLRAQHLAGALKSAHRAALLRDLTRVVQMLVDGRVPAFMARTSRAPSSLRWTRPSEVCSTCDPSLQGRSCAALPPSVCARS
jgi:hypothetical protein